MLFGGDPVQRPASLQDKTLVSGRKVGNMVVSLEQVRKGKMILWMKEAYLTMDTEQQQSVTVQ